MFSVEAAQRGHCLRASSSSTVGHSDPRSLRASSPRSRGFVSSMRPMSLHSGERGKSKSCPRRRKVPGANFSDLTGLDHTCAVRLFWTKSSDTRRRHETSQRISRANRSLAVFVRIRFLSARKRSSSGGNAIGIELGFMRRNLKPSNILRDSRKSPGNQRLRDLNRPAPR